MKKSKKKNNGFDFVPHPSHKMGKPEETWGSLSGGGNTHWITLRACELCGAEQARSYGEVHHHELERVCPFAEPVPFLVWGQAPFKREIAWATVAHRVALPSELPEVVIEAITDMDEQWPDEEGDVLWVAQDDGRKGSFRPTAVRVRTHRVLRGELA